MKITIPWWLTLIIILETLPMFLGPVAAFYVSDFLGGFGGEGVIQFAYIYSARNLAVGLALIIAFALKNGPMLFILIFVRLITDLIDLQTMLYFDLASDTTRAVIIFVFVYYIPAFFALRYLWKQMKSGDKEQDPASA